MDNNLGRERRMSRVLRHEDGKGVVIAFDHGLFMGPLSGVERLDRTVASIIGGKPDALQCTPPVANLLRENFLGCNSPALVARIDTSNMWRMHPKPKEGYRRLLYSVKDAVRAGADAAVCFLLIGYGTDDQEGNNIADIAAVASECEDYGLPLVVEPIGIAPGYQAVRDDELIKLAVRMGFEAGADLLKVDYTGNMESFRAAVECTPLPALVRGGPKTDSVEEAFQMAADAISAGARGVVFGRNVWQYREPAKMVMAYNEIVHGSGKAREAMKKLK